MVFGYDSQWCWFGSLFFVMNHSVTYHIITIGVHEVHEICETYFSMYELIKDSLTARVNIT